MSYKIDTVSSNAILILFFLQELSVWSTYKWMYIRFSRIFLLCYKTFLLKLYAYLLYAILQDANM